LKIISIFFLFFFTVAGAFAETQYGNQSTVAFGGENADITSLASIKAASLSSEEGALTAVYFLFKVREEDKSAVGLTFTLDCIEGEGDFYFSVINISKSKRGDVKEIIFSIKDMAEIDGKRVVKIANPKDYMDNNGNIEVHVSVVGGYLTLNSISVEFVKDKTEREFKKEVGLKTSSMFGAPPGVPELFLSFHHGITWLWEEGLKGWHAYDYKSPFSSGATGQEYIFHFNQGG
jgi:hypothetical protein